MSGLKVAREITHKENQDKLVRALREEVGKRLLSQAQKPLFATLQKGSEEELDLEKATRDLYERFKDVSSLPDSVVHTMALMLLDIEYVKTTNAIGVEKVYSVDPVDPFLGSVDEMLKYAKFLKDTNQEEIGTSCMAVLLVKMASCSMTFKATENTEVGRYTLLHHYLLFESIPFLQGKLLGDSPKNYLKDGKTCIKYHHVRTDNPLLHAPGFSGFQAKAAASMVNKMYCRRGKNKKNLIGDRIRSRFIVSSQQELEQIFEYFTAHCYFATKGVMDKDSKTLLLHHMEMIQLMMKNDPSVENYMFKIPKFEHEADIDCGPWKTLQMFPLRVKWNASCHGKDLKNVFNLNYYLNCPNVMQTLEGMTMLACEMQFGTEEAFRDLNESHIIYDRARIFDSNANLKIFYETAKQMTSSDFESIELDASSAASYEAHFKSFPALTLVMDERNLKCDSVAHQNSPIVTKIGSQGGSPFDVFNYQGTWGALYPCAIVWEFNNTGGAKLRYLKSASVWASDQGWGDEGHSSCALIACIGDFQFVIGSRALKHKVEQVKFVEEYRFLQGDAPIDSAVVLGDLSSYDKLYLVVRSAPHQGHEAKAFGYEVNYITEDASRL